MIFKLYKFFRPKDWLLLLVCLVLIFAQVWLELKLPDYMSEITVLVKTPNSEMGDIWLAGGKMLACALGSLVMAVLVCLIASRLASKLAFLIRSGLYNKVESFSMEEIGRFSTASLITRSTNDITQVQMFTTLAIQVLLKAPIMAIWAILKISGKSWQWSVSTAVAVFVLISILAIILVLALPKFKIMQKLTDKLNSVTRENLTGVRVVRAYNAEDYQQAKFEKANNDVTKVNLFTTRIMSILMPSMLLIMQGLSLSVYWIGAYLISNASAIDKLTIFSDMVVYSNYAMQVVMSFMMLIVIFMIMPRASVSAKRINEVLDTEPQIKDGEFKGETTQKGTVVFNHVSFKYPGASDNALIDISFTASQGQTIAIIGSTGSGKSTLINLIPRFYDATEGEILIDGVNIKDYNQKDLHNRIGYVPQKTVMFTGDIVSNVTFGDHGEREITQSDIQNAVEIAQASEFVENLPEKYNSFVSQGGKNFSGGQKQRLAIARAVYKAPEIFIFDDSFSALDYKTDKNLRSELEKNSTATNFIVAQRIGTIRGADKILVLDEGKIVGLGTHDELMQSCEVYRQIAQSQLSKEELA